MSRQRALVICPGRGVYNAPELGYIGRHHGDKTKLLSGFDHIRQKENQPNVTELDSAARFSLSKFSRGDNASALIYTSSYADFLDIDRSAYDIVGVTGNSMGWYTALACSGALSSENGFFVANKMGAIMQSHLIGGQLLYPFVDKNWRAIPEQKKRIEDLIQEIDGLYTSINLGGMTVIAGTEEALDIAEQRLPPLQGRFPMRLSNHAGFHSELQNDTSALGKKVLPESLFTQPSLPLIDGRGHVWYPGTVKMHDIWDYTLGSQVVDTYDFTKAIIHSVYELAPDVLIILGPGSTLGGATAQSLISQQWRGIIDKASFTTVQEKTPYLLSMGIEEQRKIVIT